MREPVLICFYGKVTTEHIGAVYALLLLLDRPAERMDLSNGERIITIDLTPAEQSIVKAAFPKIVRSIEPNRTIELRGFE